MIGCSAKPHKYCVCATAIRKSKFGEMTMEVLLSRGSGVRIPPGSPVNMRVFNFENLLFYF